jgi:Helix-turn-helix domain
MTRPEVADMIRTPPQTLAQWASRGFGPPYVRVGRKTLYSRTQVLKWLEDQAVGRPA